MNFQDKNYLGHRKRLINKFITHPESILDYELLEMLLFRVFIRKDTKPLAKSLLNHFKTLKNIITADRLELERIKEIGNSTVTLIILINEIFKRMLWREISDLKSIMSTSQVIEYYGNVMTNLKKEQFRIMFLNNRNKLIAEELMQEGTINTAAVYPREIVQKTLNYSASAIIMVHNHPGGDPQASHQDIIITKTIKDIMRKLDIALLDHIIIGKNKTISLKEQGVI
ncbi:MAG: DNA repair protein RadC [Holosporaceae bacterium]|jgi:DNA repair protein RadC|nr:DNA repair protein RadC [Holosporaceae bacterium]